MATKKKTTKTTKPSTKKKVVKNPHEGKRYFMLEFSGYGGELIVGHVDDDFVKYWLKKEDEPSLSDHIMAMHEGVNSFSDDMLEEEENDEVTLDVPEGFDENSPEINPGTKYIEYWELDGIEHDTVLSADYSSFTLTEVELHPKAVYQDGEVSWDDKECRKRNFDWSQKQYTEKGDSKDYNCETIKRVYTTEMFIHDTKKGIKNPVPAIMIYDAQKGTFSRIVIETDGEDFDVSKLVFGVNENSMTTHIHQYFYDKKSLSVSYDYLSTWGKGFHVEVGYIPEGDIEYDYKELLKEGWKDLEE